MQKTHIMNTTKIREVECHENRDEISVYGYLTDIRVPLAD
jgi:hypothetical protein